MKAILRDIRTNEIIVELADNLEEELTDEQIQEIIEGCIYEPEEIENVYVDYI